ncbi:MAG TPA: SatD family protein [Bacilli bacterium]
MYYAMMVDIKNSHELSIEDRKNYQLKINDAITILNKKFINNLKYKMVFSSGDSIQGLFYHLIDAVIYYYLLIDFCYPIEVRCGIGGGELSLDLSNYDSNMQDGPAYHNALKAITQCKDEDVKMIINCLRKEDYFLNEMFYLSYLYETRLSDKQADLNNLINLLLPINTKIEEDYFKKYVLTNIKHYDKIKIEELDLLNNNIKDEHTFQKNIIPTNIARIASNILGTSRENIRQMIINGDLNQIRKLRLLIIQFIKEYC